MADTMELMNRMILIFIVAAIVPGVVVLYNPGVMSYTERYREMAGFSGRIFDFVYKRCNRHSSRCVCY